jgi:type I restriction enzyme, R subunit
MSVGQVEKRTQARVVKLFRDRLGYDYLGNWIDRDGNRNIETELLSAFLKKQDNDESLIAKVLYQLEKAAGDRSKSLYDRNRAVYELLRYGVKVKADVGDNTHTVWLIDWQRPLENHFGIAEEVTVPAADAKAHGKRPDIVLYVNGLALGVLELKRSTISVAEGIRQNLDNQKKIFIEHFFSTIQFVMAGNDTEGLRYGAIQTPEKYYLRWKEEGDIENPLDRALVQLCGKERFLELIHDFVLFDAGIRSSAATANFLPCASRRGMCAGAKAASSGTPRGREKASSWSGSPAPESVEFKELVGDILKENEVALHTIDEVQALVEEIRTTGKKLPGELF